MPKEIEVRTLGVPSVRINRRTVFFANPRLKALALFVLIHAPLSLEQMAHELLKSSNDSNYFLPKVAFSDKDALRAFSSDTGVISPDGPLFISELAIQQFLTGESDPWKLVKKAKNGLYYLNSNIELTIDTYLYGRAVAEATFSGDPTGMALASTKYTGPLMLGYSAPWIKEMREMLAEKQVALLLKLAQLGLDSGDFCSMTRSLVDARTVEQGAGLSHTFWDNPANAHFEEALNTSREVNV